MKYATLAGASTESVKKHTKKDWDEWIIVLNKKCSHRLSHQQLVALLKKDFKLTPWWQQFVARGYQIAIGVRLPNQTLKGTYTTTATKTITSTAKKIWDYLVSEKGQQMWLQGLYPVKIKAGTQYECQGGVFGEFRTVKPGKALRFTWVNDDWPKKTVVNVHVFQKSKNKCMIVIDHTDLPHMRSKVEMHSRWRKAVDDLYDFLNESETKGKTASIKSAAKKTSRIKKG